ncbi:hypothetical protein [Lysinibacillus xylanilyticus]|uniref:Uncharacterized protein n=1 Tax=Lysinibacillus xylanilyticus TaxID=582475 RepID=A0ABV3VSP4_9BACI
MNIVKLTDDELSLIVTSMEIAIVGSEKYIECNGEGHLDNVTLEALEEMKIIYKKIESKYY